MANKDYFFAMKNAEASVRMEGFEVTSEMREQCQRVLDGELTTTDTLMQLLSEREQQNLHNALASTRMEGFEVTEQTVKDCVRLMRGEVSVEDTVHQAMKARRRENRSGEVQPFAGLVKCADCGSALNVSYDARRGKYTGFSCWVYKNYGKQRCTSHAIGWVALNELVKNDIRRNARAALVAPREYVDMLIAMKEQKQKNDLERNKRTLAKVDKRLAELTKILNKLYEDVALGKISEERYQVMAPTYEEEQRSLSETRAQLEREIFQRNEAYDNIEKFLTLIRKYTDVEELNAYILNELIEKIVVHEKVVDEDGIKSQQIDIYYKYVGNVNLKKAYYTEEDQARQAQAMVLLETTTEE